MIIDNEKLMRQVEQDLSNSKRIMKEPDIMSWFSNDFALRFCWSSNAIEGNTLSLDETVALVEYDEVHSGHTYSEYKEAKNLYHAIRELLIPFQSKSIDEAWIKESNRMIRGFGGEYRQGSVKIGTIIETVYIPPEHTKIPELMRTFLENVNFEAESFAELIGKFARSHLDFERIHPFEDGNGRVGRMILNQQMINHGLLPIALNKSGSYRKAFRQYDRNGDMSLMIHELLSEEQRSIERLCEFEKKKLEGFVWNPKTI